jgi:hypothetical protein
MWEPAQWQQMRASTELHMTNQNPRLQLSLALMNLVWSCWDIPKKLFLGPIFALQAFWGLKFLNNYVNLLRNEFQHSRRSRRWPMLCFQWVLWLTFENENLSNLNTRMWMDSSPCPLWTTVSLLFVKEQLLLINPLEVLEVLEVV